MQWMVNRTKAILSAIMVLFFGGYGIYFAVDHHPGGALAFLAIAGLFAWVFYRNAGSVSVDSEGVRLRFLKFEQKFLPWSEIREMGLIGESVFNHKGRSGDKYIYFSPVRMTPDERFRMIVKWPPKGDIIYLEYTGKALEYCMTLWSGELETYNVEDLYPNSGEPSGSRKKGN